MRQTGELVQWNDARGFGFIAGDDGKRYFVHISEIGRIATRPRIGDRVSFVANPGVDGKLKARGVAIAGANPLPGRNVRGRGMPTSGKSLDWRLPLALLLLLALAAAIAFSHLIWEAGLGYAAMGMISFLVYGADKRYSQRGSWRVSEATLHGIDLFFGIIGGLVGQAVFRHKTRKPGFVGTTTLIALVHLCWLAGLATGILRHDDIVGLLGH